MPRTAAARMGGEAATVKVPTAAEIVERMRAAAHAEARVAHGADEAVLERIVAHRRHLDAVEHRAAPRADDAALDGEAHFVDLECVPLVGRQKGAQLVRAERGVAARGGAGALVRGGEGGDLGVVAGAGRRALDADDMAA